MLQPEGQIIAGSNSKCCELVRSVI